MMKIVRHTPGRFENIGQGDLVIAAHSAELFRVTYATAVPHPLDGAPRIWVEVYWLDRPTRTETWIRKPHDPVTFATVEEEMPWPGIHVSIGDARPEDAQPGDHVVDGHTVHVVGSTRRTLNWGNADGRRFTTEVPETVCRLAIVNDAYACTPAATTCHRCLS